MVAALPSACQRLPIDFGWKNTGVLMRAVFFTFLRVWVSCVDPVISMRVRGVCEDAPGLAKHV